jgi:predicted CopG family antitoxin
MAQDKTIRVKEDTWRRLKRAKPLQSTMDEYIRELLPEEVGR